MGEIITFYSYKGGTGRSMAMANVAWILASRRKKVLIIDWDLEAPGLHRYFAPFLTDRDVTSSRGVIDFIREFAVRAATPVEADRQRSDWFVPLADILDYAVSLRWPYFSPGMLDLVPAGQQDASYATRVNSFSWDTFYDKLGGGAFLETMKKLIREQYDYVLIDSRTGVSDTSGICTVQLPDTVVVCFTLNNQSIRGASSVARSIAAQRTDESGKVRVRILPVATRVDTFEKKKVDRRRAYARTAFEPFLQSLPSSYWNDTEVPYWSFYAYEELLATFGDEPGAPNSMLRAFEGIASHLTNGEVRELVPPPAEERERILAAFEEIPGLEEVKPEPRTSVPVNVRANDLYLSVHHLDSSDGAALTSLLEGRRLSGIADSSRVALHDDHWAATLKAVLRDSRAFAFSEGRYGLSSLQKREIAFAQQHQRDEMQRGRNFPIIPIFLPQSNPVPDDGAWLYAQALDLRRRLDDAAALDSFARTLLAGEFTPLPRDFNPFRGSPPYGEKDAPFFFGRDPEIEELTALTTKSAVVFVTGASGVGKSSLVAAGLVPSLRRQAPPDPVWEIVRFRPDSNPFLPLVRELVSLWSLESNETSRALEVSTLVSRIGSGTAQLYSVLNLAFERPPRPSRMLIALDQAEEVFLRSPRESWKPFFRNLHAVTEHTSTTLLIAIRPEWEAVLLEIMPEWTWLLKNPFRLRPMPAETLQHVLVDSASFAGRTEPPVDAPEFVASVAGEPGALAMTARAMHRLWSSPEHSRNPAAFLTGGLDDYLTSLPESQRTKVLSALGRLVDANHG